MSTTSQARFSATSGLVLVPVILAGLAMLGPFSIDTPFPAFKQMGADLGADTAQMQLVVSAYLLAFAAMSPFHGPLSDAIGRRPVILGGVVVYAVASIGCALAPNLETLLGFRVLQGLSAGGGVIVGRTVIRDVFDGPQAQQLMSRVMMIFGLAPAIAPIIGGVLLRAGAWPVIFWFMAAVALLLIAVVAVSLPETHPPERRTPLAFGPLVRSMLDVAGSGAFHRVAWAASISFAGQFLYVGFAPILVVDLLGKGELDFWMLFVPMIAGVMAGAWLSSFAAGRISPRRLITLAMAFSGLAAVVNLALALLPTATTVPSAVIPPAFIALGTCAAYPALQLTLLDMFPASRGAAVSMFTFFTLALNGVLTVAAAGIAARSVFSLAVLAALMLWVGMALWAWHVVVVRREVPRGVRPDPDLPLERL